MKMYIYLSIYGSIDHKSVSVLVPVDRGELMFVIGMPAAARPRRSAANNRIRRINAAAADRT